MSFFDRLTGKKSAASSAKERLQLVLTHDRTDLTPTALEALKAELIEVISRHVSIKMEDINIVIEHEGRDQRLLADVPLKPVIKRKRTPKE